MRDRTAPRVLRRARLNFPIRVMSVVVWVCLSYFAFHSPGLPGEWKAG